MAENHQYNFKPSPWRNHAMEEEYNNTYLSCLQEIYLGQLVEIWVLYYQKDNNQAAEILQRYKTNKQKTSQLGQLTD